MEQKTLLKRLCNYAFQSYTGIPSDIESEKVWNVTSRTVRNWLSGNSEIPSLAIDNIRNYLKKKYRAAQLCDFENIEKCDLNCYVRLRPLSTYLERDCQQQLKTDPQNEQTTIEN